MKKNRRILSFFILLLILNYFGKKKSHFSHHDIIKTKNRNLESGIVKFKIEFIKTMKNVPGNLCRIFFHVTFSRLFLCHLIYFLVFNREGNKKKK